MRLVAAVLLGGLSGAVGLVAVPSHAATHVGYEESSTRVAYGGTWTAATDTRYTSGRAVYATRQGASATFTFTGTAVRWISSHPPQGLEAAWAEVRLDGALVATIDTAGVGYGDVVFERRNLTPQGHTLRISAKFHNAGLVIDRFLVDPGSPPTVLPAPGGMSATGSANSIGVAWNATSHADQVGYNLYRATSATGPYERVNIRPLTWTSYRDLNVWSGRQYFYRVRATDAWDNESPESAAASARITATFRTTKRYEETDLESRGAWYLSPHDSNGGADWIHATHFTFYGTAVEWIGRKGPDGGVATVVLDGQQTRHDTYRPTAAHQQVLYSRTGLPERLHHLTIYGGRGTFRSSGRAVFLDSLIVGVTGKVPTTLAVEPMRTSQDAGVGTSSVTVGPYCDSISIWLGGYFGGVHYPFCTPAVPVVAPTPAPYAHGYTSELRARLSDPGGRGVDGAPVRLTLRRGGSVVSTCDTVTDRGDASWHCPNRDLVRAGDAVTAAYAGDDFFGPSNGSSDAYQVSVNGTRVR